MDELPFFSKILHISGNSEGSAVTEQLNQIPRSRGICMHPVFILLPHSL